MKTSEKPESPLEGMTLQPDGSERKGGLKDYTNPTPRPDITPPPIGGGGGGYGSGNEGNVNPPEICPYRDCWFIDSRSYPSRYGGGSGNTKTVAIEGLEDINRALCSLGALIENIAVSLGIGIERREVFPKSGMRNGLSSVCPMKWMNKEPAVRGGDSGIGGKVEDNGA